ncbi:lantibiotic dehydratase [Streptomyces sp. NPDC000410]|uniref:lantibiotic dehydratase n=1 Tax=Streptomyces sp. NPDC000410 TaxID=3154254 RepID=UPI0033249A57
MYRHIDAALLRAVAYTDRLDLPPWPDLDGSTDADVERWRLWLERVWEQDETAEAIEVASPVLARRVHEVCDGQVRRPRQVRRAVTSLVRYLLRMEHRPTPFGLFAGVTPVRFGPGVTAARGHDHRVVARADAVWLTDVITRLEACPELLRRLPVVVDNTCFVRGGKLVVPCQQPPHTGQGGPTEVSMRHTRAVESVLKAARSPVTGAHLAGELAALYPAVPAETIDGLLAQLVARRVLLTGLRPPMTSTDALGHVVDRLTAAHAEDIAQVADLVAELTEIHGALTRHNQSGRGARRRIREAVSGRMAALSDVAEQPLVVDLRLDCAPVLPQEVAREAERAATALTRLTPSPYGSTAWQDYHLAFMERYGIGALVPVRELVDPDVGLGYPAGYQTSLLEFPEPGLTARDERLLALAQKAAVDGAREIVLDDRALDALATQNPVQIPAHAELYFHIQAPEPAALERGAFDLVVGGLYSAAGATGGRFLDLLDPADRDRLSAAYASVPTLEPDALRAQISSPPLLTRTENIGRAPAVLPHVIPLAEHGDTGRDRELPLDDLAVGGDAHRLWLVSLSTGRMVEPAVLNAVEPVRFTHPLARFLSELPRARAAMVGGFSWGAARRMPFLPRVRYGRAVLVPARWRPAAGDLAPPEASRPVWEESFTAWRKRFGLPDTVHLGEDDKRLRLDLTETAHLQLLRAHVDREGHATLHEAPEPSAYGWLDGRAHEITMALGSTHEAALPPAPRRAAPRSTIGRGHGHLPGHSPWAFVKLYGHPARQADILTASLPGLWEGWDEVPEWWFVRYRDPDPHLRLRVRLDRAEAFGRVAERVGTWAAGRRELGLVGRIQWDTYHPETGRYGTGAAMAAAESVFAADSAAALAQLALTTGGRAHPMAMTVASFVDLACSFAGNTGDGMRALVEQVRRTSGPATGREIQDAAMRLADPGDGFAALRDIPGGEDVVAAWERRRTALAAYRSRLAGEDDGPDPASVLGALLHMHHNRAAGIDEDAERACLRMARSVALSWAARGGTTE